jgi:hypothetical protein
VNLTAPGSSVTCGCSSPSSIILVVRVVIVDEARDPVNSNASSSIFWGLEKEQKRVLIKRDKIRTKFEEIDPRFVPSYVKIIIQ